MNLASVFKLSLYSVTALAGWILGAAEEGWIPYGSLLAVFVGYVWSEGEMDDDRPRGMNDLLASFLGFVALCASTSEFFSENVEGRLLSGTHLVVYLTWIVLLQRKTNRRYWLLMALSILQIAVGAVLIGGLTTFWFGAAAVVYVFGAVWTLSVFSLYRSAAEFSPTTTINAGSINQTESTAIGSVHNANGTTWITAPFISGVAFTSASGLFVSVLFFALIPRVWIPTSGALANEDLPSAIRSQHSAFATEVRLGDIGSILESLDPVMQVKLQTARREPLSPQVYAEQLGYAEPLFRGTSLSVYDEARWKFDPRAVLRPTRLIPYTPGIMVRQDIRLEYIGTDALFCLGTPQGVIDNEGQPRGGLQPFTGLISRHPDMHARGTVRYSVFTETPGPERKRNGTISVNSMITSQSLFHQYIERNRQVPQGLTRLQELARKVISDAEQHRKLTPLQAAREIEIYLRESGRYSYTLSLSVTDPTIDPVEDFLFNRKEGHCEYFASALVLMLRSIDIPARLITGFKGGNYDQPTNTLHVQQRHAHAWCEAWIDGAWVTLDATPVDERSASVEAVLSNRSLWNDMRTQLAGIWADNVVNISLETQEEVFYRPIREFIASIGKMEVWKSPQAGILSFLKLLVNPRQWFSPEGAGALFVTIASGWIAFRVLRRFRWGHWKSRQVVTGHQRIVEFYERFARLMQSLNLQRQEAQTQHEFAQQAASVLKPRLELAGLTRGPAEIADLFYQVRFGDRELPPDASRRIDDLLNGMEQALSPRRS